MELSKAAVEMVLQAKLNKDKKLLADLTQR